MAEPTEPKRALSPNTAADVPSAKRVKGLDNGIFQFEDHSGIWFKFKTRKDAELDWFHNITVVAYRGEPPPPKEDKPEQPRKKKENDFLSELFGGLSTYSLRRGGAAAAIEMNHAGGTTDMFDGADEATSEDDEDHVDAFEGSSAYEDEEESDTELEQVGNVFARLLQRGKIRRHFWRDMEEPSQDTAALAFNIFDWYGCLREEFVTGTKKGSSVFGHEIDTGNILQIEVINVNLAYRRQGLAHTMLQILIDGTKKLDEYFRVALAWPTFLNSNAARDLPADKYERLRDDGENVAIALFRKSGFRRVRTSSWFAFAVNVVHPSHKLSASEDCQPLTETLSELQKLEKTLEKSRTRKPHNMMTIVVSDHFKGFSNIDVKRLLKLRNIASPSALTIAHARYGCTCGECVAGFLSPRMLNLMTGCAKMEYDMQDDLDFEWDFRDGEDDFMAPTVWKYLPASVKPYMKSNKSNRRGLQEIYNHVLTCLRAKRAPTIGNIISAADNASEWPPHTKNFLNRAGAAGIEAVLRALFDCMKDRDLKAGGGIDIIADHDECPPDALLRSRLWAGTGSTKTT